MTIDFNPTWIVIHHNAKAGRTVKDIRRTHVDGFGWDDIGYHTVIEDDPLATRRDGRPEDRPGAHASGANGWAPGAEDDTLALCIVGNFNVTRPTMAQWLAAIREVRGWMARYNIRADNVIGHREIALVPGAKPTRKSCPGKLFDLEHFRQDLELGVDVLCADHPTAPSVTV